MTFSPMPTTLEAARAEILSWREQHKQAAAELRRLHNVNKQLLDALESRDSGDPECEHGFFYEECPNETCDKRSYKAAIAAARGQA